MEITGSVHEVLDERIITEKFKIREFALRVDNGQYPETILFQTANQTIKLLDSLIQGETVKVHFNIGGREAKGRYYNSLKCFKIEVVGKSDILPNSEQKESRNVHQNVDSGDHFKDNRPVTESHPLPADDGSDLPFVLLALISISSIILF